MFILSRYLFMFYSAQTNVVRPLAAFCKFCFCNYFVSTKPMTVTTTLGLLWIRVPFLSCSIRPYPPSVKSVLPPTVWVSRSLFRTSPLPALPVHSFLKNILQRDFLSFQSKFSRCPCCPVLDSIHMLPIFSFYFSRLFVGITFLALLARANEN